MKGTSHIFYLSRLYNGINLTYPPALAGIDAKEEAGEGDDRVYALNQSLHRTVLPEEVCHANLN